MNIARYKKGMITVAEYDTKLHSGNIFCLDCGEVPVKLIRKANEDSYFKFTDGEHDKLCPHYAKPIGDETIVNLMSSDSPKDMSRLNILVNTNLERSIDLLNKLENNGVLHKEDSLNLMPRKRELMVEKRIHTYSKTNIKTVNAADLSTVLADIAGKYVVIYGIAGIKVEDIQNSKKILFKVNKESIFSIFITPNQAQHFSFAGSGRAKFAIFGKIKISGKHINIDVRSTRDFVIRD